MSLKAILFDCDGVIAETEISRFRHLKNLAEEKGYFGLEEKQHLKFLIGKQSKELLRHVFGNKISERLIEEIVNKRRQDWEDSPERFITGMNGIRHICEVLSRKYSLAVTSTATRKTVEATLKHIGLGKYFKLVMTQNDVKMTKPAPDVYLETLNRLGLKAGECLAIEDSPNGVASAKDAGIKVVALKNKLYEEYGYNPDLSSADIVIENLADLLKIVRSAKRK